MQEPTDNLYLFNERHMLEPDYRDDLWALRGFWNVLEEDTERECKITPSQHDSGGDTRPS